MEPSSPSSSAPTQVDGQTETIRPALSKASDPQIDGEYAPEDVWSDVPSGPERW